MGRPVNFEYGNAYVTLQRDIAMRYAKKFGGELLALTITAASILAKQGHANRIPEWVGWHYQNAFNAAIVIGIAGLPLHQIRSESGGTLSPFQRRALHGQAKAEAVPATDLTFRISGTIPPAKLTAHLIHSSGPVPICIPCFAERNPLAAPVLPTEPIKYNPEAKTPPGMELVLSGVDGCHARAHPRGL